MFSRLGSQLVLSLAHFLDLKSLAHLACTNRFLRIRLSLSIKGTPSLGLASLRYLWITDKHLPKMPKIFERLSSLLTLHLKMESGFVPRLPSTLLHLHVNVPPINSAFESVIIAANRCVNLESLSIRCCYGSFSAFYVFKLVPLRLDKLRTLSIHDTQDTDDNTMISSLLENSPSLTALHIEDCSLSAALLLKFMETRPSLRALSLNRVVGTGFFVDVPTVSLAKLPLEQLTIHQCPEFKQSITEFPVTLQSLDCQADAIVTSTAEAGPGCRHNVRSLTVHGAIDSCDSLITAAGGFPKLAELGLTFLGLTFPYYETLHAAANVIQRFIDNALPLLQSLTLIIGCKVTPTVVYKERIAILRASRPDLKVVCVFYVQKAFGVPVSEHKI